MKHSEDKIRDAFGTIVTFLVLALLLFHSPYSKAQGTRVDKIEALRTDFRTGNFSDSNYQSKIQFLFFHTFGYDYQIKIEVESTGMLVINQILEKYDPKLTMAVLKEMSEVSLYGARFSSVTQMILIESLGRIYDPEITSMTVRILKRYKAERGVARAIAPYILLGSKWVRKCGPSVAGMSAVAGI